MSAASSIVADEAVRTLPRVAHLGPDPAIPGGMGAVVSDLLESPLGREYRLEAIPTYRTPGRVQRVAVFAGALVGLARWCRGDGQRIVHIHMAVRGSLYRKSLCVAVAKAAGRPTIVHLHAGPGDMLEFYERIGPLRRRLFSAALRSADRILSVSSAGGRELERLFGVAGVITVPNAVPSVPRPADGGRAPGRADGALDVLYVGGFADPAKGGAVLVEALPAIVAALPGAHVALAGPGEPPPALEALVADGAGVEWVGWLDAADKHARLAACDVFALPSLSEGLPVALLEAMAHGRAIVASAMGGVPDVLAAEDDALLVAPGDPVALTRALERLAGSSELCARLGAAAAARAARLTREEVAGRLDAIYRELLS